MNNIVRTVSTPRLRFDQLNTTFTGEGQLWTVTYLYPDRPVEIGDISIGMNDSTEEAVFLAADDVVFGFTAAELRDIAAFCDALTTGEEPKL